MLDEIRVGFEELRAMSHDELRQVINKRVTLLETVLREREERRAAITPPSSPDNHSGGVRAYRPP